MRRMNQTSRGLVAVLEEEEIKTPAAVAEPEVAIGDNAENLETDMIEAGDAAADVDALQSDTDATAEVSEALESIVVSLRACAKEGGMDRHSAACVGTAVDALYKQVGIRRRSFPALESFGQTSSRIRATEIAMEEITDQLKKVWLAIVAAVEKAIAWVADFYNKVVDAAGKLEKRAADLKAKAEKTEGEAGSKTIENERVAAALASSKGVGDLGAIKATVAAVERIAKIASSSNAIAVGEDALKALDDVKVGVAAFKVDNFGKDMGEEVSGEGFEAPGEGMKLYRSDELVGNKAFFYASPAEEKKGHEAAKVVSQCKLFAGTYNPKAAEPAKELPTLSGADAASLCDEATKLSKELVSMREEAKKLEDIRGKLVEKAKKLGAAADKLGEDSETGKALASARLIVQGVSRLFGQPVVAVTSYGISTGKAMLDYVELSLKAYGKKEEPQAEEKKDDAGTEEKKDGAPAEGAAA